MKLEDMTWLEVKDYLRNSTGAILPVGSIEQHGPIGLIGTDAICAREVSWAAAEQCGGLVVPEIAYAPAPFNMSFPGTILISFELLEELAHSVFSSLAHHGFDRLYMLNGHGANLEPLNKAAGRTDASVRIRSWWDFSEVNALRTEWYGDWEGMHATPSEVAITQHTHRVIEDPDLKLPEKLSRAYTKAHAGDKHGEAEEHRRRFPAGRVGSHSGLATPAQGELLFETAAREVAADYLAFLVGD